MKETFLCSIDGYLSGFLSGWVFNSGTPNDAQIVSLQVNGRIVTKFKSDLFRQDLKDEKIGSGAHGFNVFIQHYLISGQDNSIVLLTESGEEITKSPFVIEKTYDLVKATLLRKELVSFDLAIETNFDEDFIEQDLAIYVSNKFLTYQRKHIRQGAKEITIMVPEELLDNLDHLVTIGLRDESNCLWQGFLQFKTILTPREHLKNHDTESGMIGGDAQSQFRYESLKLHLDSGKNLDEIAKAHTEVLKGWEKRKNFPNLTIPYYEKPTVSIIIPAHNKFELTYHCIASIILAYDETPYEIILADDCSTDETTIASEIIKNLKVIHNPKNLMFLRNCNNAAKSAIGDYILFLNNDTEVTSFWLQELIDSALNFDAGLVGSKLLNEDGTLQEAGGIVWSSCAPWNVGNGQNPNKPEFNYIREADYLSGAALCIRKDVWEEVEGFSEYLVPAYFEDTDIAFKVREAGYKTLYVPHSQVFHFEGMSHGTDLTQGVKKNQVINAKKFAQKWHATTKYNGKEGVNIHLEKDRGISRRILVLDYTVPSPSTDAGSYAAIQEIKLMQSLGFKVTFAADNLAHLGSLTTDLQKLGVEVLYAPYYLSIDDMLTRRLPEMDAIYITRYYVADKVIEKARKINPNVPILFNNADLHFLRELRAALKGGKNQKLLEQAIATRDVELAICNKVDAVLCYSEAEKAVITSHILESEKIHITPWVLEEKNAGTPFKQRSGISFLGGFNHKPNVEAVQYLAEKIMPLLGEVRPDIVLNIYGSKMPKEMKLIECDNINVVGFAESLDDVFNTHRVFVAPLLSGAGIKGKVLEAMAYKVPCVLSDLAAEGTGLTDSISCLTASSPEIWVENIIKLYDDENLWHQIADNEERIVKTQYSKKNGIEKFNQIFEFVGIYSSVNSGLV